MARALALNRLMAGRVLPLSDANKGELSLLTKCPSSNVNLTLRLDARTSGQEQRGT
jgi:hypothetical protein